MFFTPSAQLPSLSGHERRMFDLASPSARLGCDVAEHSDVRPILNAHQFRNEAVSDQRGNQIK